MNSSGNPKSPADASGTKSEASGSQSPHNNSSRNKTKISECDSMKRAAARKLIERYFYQLIDGCGNPNCDNEYCASNADANIKNLTPNQAAAQAIQLFSQEARLCDRAPRKVARTNKNGNGQSSTTSDNVNSSSTNTMQQNQTSSQSVEDNEMPDNDLIRNITNNKSLLLSNDKDLTEALNFNKAPVEPLTEEKLISIIEQCKKENCYITLLRTLTEVFSDLKVLARSFPAKIHHDTEKDSPIDALLNRAPGDLTSLKKEDVRILEGENEKDEDSCCSENDALKASGDSSQRPHVDLESVRRAFLDLFVLPANIFEQILVTAITACTTFMQMKMLMQAHKPCNDSIDDMINAILIICEIPFIGSGEFLETALPSLCKVASQLPISAQATLARRWAEDGKPMLQTLLEGLQQLISLRVIVTHFHSDYYVQDEPFITSATKLMKVFHFNLMNLKENFVK